ncbi:MAG: phosphotransferase [Pseudomonadota bacterium]
MKQQPPLSPPEPLHHLAMDWNGYQHVRALEADASPRRYWRFWSHKKTFLGVVTPDIETDFHQFARIQRFLSHCGLSAPRFLKIDFANHCALIEDFGQLSLNTLLRTSSKPQSEQLYLTIVKAFAHLHQTIDGFKTFPPLLKHLKPYKTDLLLTETNRFLSGYLTNIRHDIADLGEFEQTWHENWSNLFSKLRTTKPVLVQRDCHIDNILWLKRRKSIRQCGFIDFQDATLGHRAYDLMSILEDARSSLAPSIIDKALHLYRVEMGLNNDDWVDFLRCYHILGASRHAKVLGIFMTLSLKPNCSHYLKHIPRVEMYLKKKFQLSATDQFDLKPLKNIADLFASSSVLSKIFINE